MQQMLHSAIISFHNFKTWSKRILRNKRVAYYVSHRLNNNISRSIIKKNRPKTTTIFLMVKISTHLCTQIEYRKLYLWWKRILFLKKVMYNNNLSNFFIHISLWSCVLRDRVIVRLRKKIQLFHPLPIDGR